MDTYGIEEARNQLGDFIERIRLNDEHIALSRYGKPVAVLVPLEWYEEAGALISALIVANRLTRAADLILESREDPPDIEREAHRLGAPVELPGSSFKAGDVISVPPEVVRVTGFRPNSRLVIKRRRASQRAGKCKACGAAIEAGDLYAAATDPMSDRCIRCVDGWPLAATGPKGLG